MTHEHDSADRFFTASLDDMPGIAAGEPQKNRIFISRQGAQVLSWRDGSGRERMYLSPISGGFKRGGGSATPPAIRGGVPVCFPQFSGRGSLPKHGLVRNMLWSREAAAGDASTTDAGARHSVTLTCRDDAGSRLIWPQRFSAQLAATVTDDRLQVALEIVNNGDQVWEFTVALHTYFAVRNIADARLRGLSGVSYQDATDNNRLCVQAESDLRIAAELDRVYISPPSSLLLLEQGVPSLRIEQYGFADSVVWNPGPQKAAALSDFPDDDWQRMLCVEAACVMQPVRLAPGARWQAGQIMTVLPESP